MSSATTKINRFRSVDDLPDLIPTPEQAPDIDVTSELEPETVPVEEVEPDDVSPEEEPGEETPKPAVSERTDVAPADSIEVAMQGETASVVVSAGLTAPNIPDLDGGTYRVSFDIPEDREAEISVALAGKRWSHGRKVGKAQLFRAALLVVLDNIDISALGFEHPHELEAEIAAALTEAARS